MPPLRIGTFNIRNSNAGDGPDAWPLRRAALVETVRRFGPDVVGFQEVLADQQDDLVAAMSEYGCVAVHRDDGRRAGEAASVFYRRSRFDLIDGDAFWLSDTPDRPGPPAWDAACTRLCTRATFHDRAAGRPLQVLNTHLDHVGETAQRRSVELIVRRMAACPYPTVLMGDFNSTEDGPVYAALLAAARAAGRPLADAHRHAHPMVGPDEATYHGFTGTTGGLRIDWLLHDSGFVTTHSTIDTARAGSRYASDHYPLWAELRVTR